MLYQHAKYMYPESMMVFKCKTHSSGKGKQREVERAAKPRQQTPYRGKWQETDEKLWPKDAAACCTARERRPRPGAEHGPAGNGGGPG